MGRRKTTEEFNLEVNKLTNGEYTLLSKYKNSITKVKLRHNECGEIYLVRPNNFLNGNRCKRCMDKKKLKKDKEFKKQVDEIVGDEYTFLEEYRRALKEIKVRHNKCKTEWYIKPHKFLLGARCYKCYLESRKKGHEVFKKEVYDLVGDEYIVVSKYKNIKTKVTMRHVKCGNVWKVVPLSFLRGNRCPKCSRYALKSTEKFAREVKEKTKNEYLVLGEYKNFDSRVMVKHKTCGSEFFTFPNTILRGSACKKCANEKKRKGIDEFKREVTNLVGDEYIICGEYRNNKTKIDIKHIVCGNVWSVAPSNFLRGRRCPKCSRSKGEKVIGDLLDRYNINYIAEYRFKDCKCKGMLIFDFAILGGNEEVLFLIKYDGIQHYRAIKIFNGQEGYASRKIRDKIKNVYCKTNEIDLIRIPYWKYKNIEKIVLKKLYRKGLI